MWYSESLESTGAYFKQEQLSYDLSQGFFAIKQESGCVSQGRRRSFDPGFSYKETHIHEMEPCYNDAFFNGLSQEFISMNLRPRSISCGSVPDTPRSVTNRSSPSTVSLIVPCRQLPCRTFICTGTCPYGDRCVFLHDPRIESNCPALRARLRKSKEDSVSDSFFWHTMPRHEVQGKTDGRNLPAISQHYIVPNPALNTIGLTRDVRNNDAVYSLWSYFLDFLVTDPASMIQIPRWSLPLVANERVNKHTGKRRLNLFVTMSEGKCLQSCPSHFVNKFKKF